MRRLVGLVVALVVCVPATAMATELDDLLRHSQEATYSAEQTISCSTPDGVRDAIVRITQTGKDLKLSSNVSSDVEIASGSGNWSLWQGGGLVAEAAVGGSSAEEKEVPLYTVEGERALEYLGRDATTYVLSRGGEARAELIIDDETGAVVEAVTYSGDGAVYCERRFISLDTDITGDTLLDASEAPDSTEPVEVETTTLPDSVEGFDRVDEYEDETGLRFAYYSDGFFSFAVFETPAPVELADAIAVDLESGRYHRLFTAGQVTYVWETRAGGMALVGDLPPDLHPAVLAALPGPEDPGFFGRFWREIFG